MDAKWHKFTFQNKYFTWTISITVSLSVSLVYHSISIALAISFSIGINYSITKMVTFSENPYTKYSISLLSVELTQCNAWLTIIIIADLSHWRLWLWLSSHCHIDYSTTWLSCQESTPWPTSSVTHHWVTYLILSVIKLKVKLFAF